MTEWQPAHLRGDGPLYLALAQALADDIASGRLAAGARLPAQRMLAYRLGTTVATVGRAYAEIQRQGLIGAAVGRGTHVLDRRAAPPENAEEAMIGQWPASARETHGPAADSAQPVNLEQNIPIMGDEGLLLGQALTSLAAEGMPHRWLDYQPHAGMPRQRAVLAGWLALTGVPAQADTVAITCGAQHGLDIALSCIAAPGDVVAADVLTYPGTRVVIGRRHLRAAGIPGDAEGMLPEALEAFCRLRRPAALQLTPNLSNPLTSIMSLQRRQEIVAIARRYDIMIVEDDVYGFLTDRPPPFAALAPERCFHVSGLAKSLASGLRVGVLHAPPERMEAVRGALRASIWSAPALTAEIACRWIEDGTAARLAVQKRAASARRQAIARDILGIGGETDAYHLWMDLPPRWNDDAFAAAARVRGAAVTPSRVFRVAEWDGMPPAIRRRGVRLCLGAPRGEEELRQGLMIVRTLRDEAEEPAHSIV